MHLCSDKLICLNSMVSSMVLSLRTAAPCTLNWPRNWLTADFVRSDFKILFVFSRDTLWVYAEFISRFISILRNVTPWKLH